MQDKIFKAYEWVQNRNKVRLLRVILALLLVVPFGVIPVLIKDTIEWLYDAYKEVFQFLKDEWNRERKDKNG